MTFCRHHDLLTVTEYLCHKLLRICSVCLDQNHTISSYYHQVCNTTGLIVKQELFTLPEYTSSPPCFLWCSCFSIFTFLCSASWIIDSFLFAHCPFSIYGFMMTPLVSSYILQISCDRYTPYLIKRTYFS